MENPRKNPKRKVSETQEHHGPDDEAADLLLRACSPLTVQDIEDWQGWVELESEPAFFNTILRDLGVRNVKVQELFTMDQDSLDAVSKPVFGLVFLFQYDPAHQNEEQVHDSEAQIWFANQTTNNACATVALLNIIMNAPDIELGQQLTDFKDATKNLDTSLRGHRISSNKFIRSIHNSFTRRIDHLNADLCLENDYDEAQSRAKKKASSAKARQRSGRGKRAALEYGYHFIAYVPCDGLVWELDGLRNKPQEIGPTNGNDWTTVARPQIEAKMLQYEGSQLSFNLLAVCRSSSSQLSQVIATMIAALRTIQSRMKSDTGFTDITSADEPLLNMHDEAQLAEFNLCKEDIENAKLPARLESALFCPEWQNDDTYDMYQSFRVQLRSAIDEFRVESFSAEEEDRRVKNRKRDYGGALHCWTKKLAEKGVLEDIIRMSS
ncbi:hypothetical protein C2857_002774 [Epichloe festucae Fl1]|uniref:Ubiquitin carboxyl-terminal hydrolase n=1 Tax=Epichloe festucae (strain Fl1) TaxID=877507 RepID=A0A7S9PRY5_EPIFF|nr:hypothetical protein C2857_002774 [Epichloe festucae Fl1]